MKTLVKTTVFLTAITVFLLYSPTLLDFNPYYYSIPFPDFHGPLEENDLLSKAEHLHTGVLRGPESIVFHEGALYTGLMDGRIVKVKGEEVTTIAQTGRFCEYPQEERLCGRPLGLRKGKNGLLYVIDAFYGILTMNFTTGTLTRILSSSILVEGQALNFPDDLDIDDDGNIYFSDASSKWDISTILYMMFENEASGRVIRFNMNSGDIEVLASNLHFPNGVQLSKDKKSLLVSELLNRRILRFHLKGKKKGKFEVFADHLPAEPDNIRASSRGYWVAFSSARNSTNRLMVDVLNSYPSAKRVFARAHSAVGTLMVTIAELVSHPILKEMAYKFKRGDYYLNLFPRHGIVIEFDENGKILRSLHCPDGKTSDLSEAVEHQGYLYLGSFLNNYLGRLKL